MSFLWQPGTQPLGEALLRMPHIIDFEQFCKINASDNKKASIDCASLQKASVATPASPADDNTKIMTKLVHLLNTSSKIIVILGAGVSVSAGIPVQVFIIFGIA
jgi:hypothetical protein